VTVPTAGQEIKRATIDDVARLAGVSRSTVSNALNHRTGRLAEATAHRIQEAAKTLRYVPDGLARQLKRGHADMIGVIVPSVANPFWGEFVRAVEEAALRRNFGVLVGSSDRSLHRERAYMETMYQQGIRTMVFGHRRFRWTTWPRRPSAGCSSSRSTGGCTKVTRPGSTASRSTTYAAARWR
jgi:transcriptional regulator with XRE-family HTH domain